MNMENLFIPNAGRHIGYLKRLCTVLKKNNINNIDELIKMKPEDIIKLPGIGWISYIIIIKTIKENEL